MYIPGHTERRRPFAASLTAVVAGPAGWRRCTNLPDGVADAQPNDDRVICRQLALRETAATWCRKVKTARRWWVMRGVVGLEMHQARSLR